MSEERKASNESESASDIACYAAHLDSAYASDDLDGEQCELTFGMEGCYGGIYSFASDANGVTVRFTEPGEAIVDLMWVPYSLFGAMRRAMEASQEKRS